MGSISNHKNHHDTNLMDKSDQVVVLMVPFQAQGHLNQLLQLSCLVSSYGLPVHYVGSAIHNRQAKARANGLNANDVAKIHFHDIPTPPFDSPPPNPNSSNKFPEQLQPAWEAMLNLRKPIACYLQETSKNARRVIVVHDPMMALAVQDVNTIPNAESYAFNCISAFSQVSLVWESLGKQVPIEHQKLPIFMECIPEKLLEFVALQSEPSSYRAGDLYNTCRLIEAPYLDLLEKEEINGNRKSWAIGPILPAKLSSERQHKCLEWLDKHGPKSVIYVSFGTTTSLSDKEIKELASGLEQSKVKFIWNAVERLMVSEEGDEIRKRAEELAATVRQATQEGGASRLELDSFIDHITR
ncbi:hypothetical protein BUALT_Bualt16G0118200 [Buddleja alternifolia]|uniref:Glycosyltransferase N-terminal domain-containing protein n=1 Tax=Buddleja alternifolia TaxID=168488 RepID=A0AAV6WIS5_9LAMI|nr:hypothetical protein BUALT_Bualt16G0118200 [Buddleja alternifolia]